MIYVETPGRVAVTTSSSPDRARCLDCHGAVVVDQADPQHWAHADGSPDCLVAITDRGLRVAGRPWSGDVEPLAAPPPAPPPTMAAWALERLALAPGAILHPDAARADYLAWASDRPRRLPDGRVRAVEPRSKMRAAIKNVGGTPKGTGEELRYLDVTLDGPAPDSGYRVARMSSSEGPGADPLPALAALASAGLVTDPRALDQAAMRLSGQAAAGVCGKCGRITRHEGRRHVGC